MAPPYGILLGLGLSLHNLGEVLPIDSCRRGDRVVIYYHCGYETGLCYRATFLDPGNFEQVSINNEDNDWPTRLRNSAEYNSYRTIYRLILPNVWEEPWI